MCGIAAILKLDNSKIDLSQFRGMCSALSHRGPDDSGYASLCNGELMMGSVRLSIVDINGGNQPFFNKANSITLVCNGEIYDYSEWKLKLMKNGHNFMTSSDSELIIHMYEEYGIDFISMLNGEFSFILWDKNRQRLIVARDRIGVKPLYYFSNSSMILFSSEIKGLFAVNDVPRRISPEFANGAAMVINDNISAFQNIHNLRPGHFKMVERGKVSDEIPYFTWTFNTQKGMHFNDAKELVNKTVKRAVARRIVADVPVNCYLSGGLDSTIICGLMAENITRFKTFNISFPNSGYDEYEKAKSIANYFGQEMETIRCTNEVLISNLIKTIDHVEMPLANCNAVGKMLLSELAHSHGERVCLSGEGADEVFGGYAFFKLENLWQKRIHGEISKNDFTLLWNRFQDMEKRSFEINWDKNGNWKKGGTTYSYPSYLHLKTIANSKFAGLLFKNFAGSNYIEDKFLNLFPPESSNKIHPFNATRLMAFQILSGALLPSLADRVEMANSIECRTPFLDSDVLKAATIIPPEYFQDPKELQEKLVLHHAFIDLLPEFAKDKHKHPFIAPTWKSILNNPSGREILSEYLSDNRVRRAGVFHPNAIKMIKLIWNRGDSEWNIIKRLDPIIGVLLTSHILYDRFIENNIIPNKEFDMIDRSK